jgi:RHS repeat-associated protein
VIHIDSRVVGESVPLVGTPWTLNYFTDRVRGRSGNYSIKIPMVDNDYLPTNVAGIELSISSFGMGITTHTENRNPTTGLFDNESHKFTWDPGNNLGSAAATVSQTINFVGGSSYLLSSYSVYTVGTFNAVKMGLGGWTISAHHFLDKGRRLVYRGDGGSEGVVYWTFPTSAPSYYYVQSLDGTETWQFHQNGTHYRTLDSRTGSVRLEFGYDGSGRLSTITDAYSNVTTIQRDGSGVLTGIQAPRGQVTELTLDSNGYLASIENPNSETWEMTYSGSLGLISTFEMPGGQVSTFTFDADGNLLTDSNSSGASWEFTLNSQTHNAFNISMESALGRSTTYAVDRVAAATSRTVTDPQGFTTSFSDTPPVPSGWIGSGSSSWADVSTASASTYHPRYNAWGMSGRHTDSRSVTTSQSTLSQSESFSYSGFSSYPFGYASETRSVTTNSKTFTETFTQSTGTLATTSPVGRVKTEIFDTYGKPTSWKWANFNAVTFGYDSYGRLNAIDQSTRGTDIAYNSAGYVSSITNALSEATSFTYDSAGRVLTQTLPDSRVITFAYDANGNITSITPPSTGAHGFTNNSFDLVSGYQPPSLPGPVTINTTYTYNNDKQLTEIARPDGEEATFNYHSTGGQLTSITLPNGSISFTYSNGRVATAQSPDEVKNELAYNGTQVKQDIMKIVSPATTLSTLDLTYNNDFRLTTSALTTGSASSISFTYDNDGLLTGAGSETISRSSTTGFITGTTLNNISDSYTYNSTYGEIAAYSATYTPTPTTVFSQSITRDALGRISAKSETVNGTTHTYDYTYDSAGRLIDVNRDSAAYSDYTYSTNSNRTSGTVGGTSFSGTYDSQDRLTEYNALDFTYNLNGERSARIDTSTSPNPTTTYNYDELGDLKQVVLPSSDVLDYVLDAFGRRVGKKLNSTLQTWYVYEDQLRIGGVLNSSGTLTQRFVYGSKLNVPDYMVASGTTYRIISDERGSVRLVVNASTGSIAQQIEYDEFGRVLSDTSPGFQPFGYAGCLYDNDTKLCHFGAREYDAEVGRWLQKDPILFYGQDTNLYGYTWQDPVNFVDPTGHASIRDIGSWVSIEMLNQLRYFLFGTPLAPLSYQMQWNLFYKPNNFPKWPAGSFPPSRPWNPHVPPAPNFGPPAAPNKKNAC